MGQLAIRIASLLASRHTPLTRGSHSDRIYVAHDIIAEIEKDGGRILDPIQAHQAADIIARYATNVPSEREKKDALLKILGREKQS